VKQLYYTGYDQTTIEQPSARQAAQGDYFVASTVPLTKQYPGAATFLNALKKYDPSYKGGIPDFGLIGGWLSTDLMIKGLEVAGKNPTRSAFISNLQKVTSYNAEGLLPGPVGFDDFGHLPAHPCAYYMQLAGSSFRVATPGRKPLCGTVIPNSNTE
jgi:branched-chain amino acid transport system substrate-binding protein